MASPSRTLLQPLLARPYDRTTVVRDVLAPVFDGHFTALAGAPAPYTLTTADKSLLREVRQLANVHLDGDDAGIEVPVLEVRLRSGVRPEHSRVGIQQFIRRHLTVGSAALLLFVSDEPTAAWRLTLVVADATLDPGTGKTTRTLSHARRYTFLLGPGQGCRTPAERLENLFKSPDLTLAALTTAFGVETLSKAFFAEYKRHYTTVCDWILASPMYTSVFKGNRRIPVEHLTNKAAAKHVRDFSKRLLGRIVFLYFVQKKGWLGASSAAYADGDPDFVRNLFRSSGANATFYPVWLSKLFFETLNAPRTQDAEAFILPDKTRVKVPFLNGGLFDRAAFEDAASTTALVLPPTLFCATAEADREVPAKRGFLDFLGAYNFTVHEDAPGDHTVAVDPEMLGSIFENLLEDNHEKGAYYTPKEIVHYMCRESLTEYLRTQLPALRAADDQPDYLATFVQTHELLDALRPHAAELDKKLEEVKICDPAIGSGAFPMGLLLEIYQCRLTLTEAMGQPLTGEARAALKLAIIQTSIYGVDIEPGAVDIARLRFWLALVVDEETPRALPNLDYKIVVGDSLVSRLAGQPLTLSWGKGSTAREKALLAKYRDYQQAQADYFRASGKTKDQLHAQIDQLKANLLLEQIGLDREKIGGQQAGLFGSAPPSSAAQRKKDLADLEKRIVLQGLEKQLTNSPALANTYFDWALAFPEVLNPHLAGEGQQVGFDIVIGNPPYVGLNRLEAAADYATQGYQTFEKGSDIYCLFYELGLARLLRPNGVLTFITSNSWMQTRYGKSLRNLLTGPNADPVRLLDFADAQLFDTAVVEANILMARRAPYSASLKAATVRADYERGTSLWAYADSHVALLPELPEEGWAILSPKVLALKKKMEAAGPKLADWPVSINYGVKTGYNEAFIIDGATRARLIAEDPRSADVIKPTLRGRDLKRYHATSADLWIIFIPWHFPLHKDESIQGSSTKAEKMLKKDYPSLYQYFAKHEKSLRARNQAETGIRYEWYVLQRCAASYVDDFDKPKIIWGELSDEAKFTLDLSSHYVEATLFMMTGEKLPYLLSVLNSKAGAWYFNLITTTSGMGTTRWKKYKIEQLPVPQPSAEINDSIEKLVAAIIEKKSKGIATENEEAKVDALVYKTFGLSKDEISLIEAGS